MSVLRRRKRKLKEVSYGPYFDRQEHRLNYGERYVNQIVSWLEQNAAGDQPFFMACGILATHAPFVAPGKYFDLYPKEELVFSAPSPEFWDQAPRMAQYRRYQDFGFKLGVENDSLRRDYIQAYHACVSYTDDMIASICDALKRTGHWDDTIIVLTSDQGFMLGEHFMWGKMTLFEECARVPLIIRAPGVTQPGSTSQGLVELVDLFPTLAELCRVAPPKDLQGRSLAPMLRDPNQPGKKTAYTVVSRDDKLGKAIRTRRWRYTRWPVGEELYDLVNDPGEQKNLAGAEDYAGILAVMRNHLNRCDRMASEARYSLEP
jgi:iduronate 2-sulfatase